MLSRSLHPPTSFLSKATHQPMTALYRRWHLSVRRCACCCTTGGTIKGRLVHAPLMLEPLGAILTIGHIASKAGDCYLQGQL